MTRELIVLGTASQAPTRHRNHNGYVMRWDENLVLFDPGEGTQRQFTHAGVAAARVTAICVTHFHGDHCLGLPGIIQRLCGDRVTREIPIFHPAAGADFLERLRFASAYEPITPFVPVPIAADGPVGPLVDATLSAVALDHRIPTYGYRIQEPTVRRFRVDALLARGVAGPDVGRLRQDGAVTVNGQTVQLADVSDERPGQSMALVMDTRLCDAAFEIANGVDLLVCESTFLESEAALATEYGHLTAAQAGRIAAEAGARRLVLTHFSSRYTDTADFVAEAAQFHSDVVAVSDFDRVAVPSRLAAPD